jgi:uncharacterized protein YgbK (DUF1537 family)
MTTATRLNKSNTLTNLPPAWPSDLIPAIQQQLVANQRTLVVLDDDPTGTQTVYGVPVLTAWSVETLQAEFAQGSPVFYVLTNSRSLPLPAAQALNAEIAHNLLQAAQQTGADFAVVSRSDSTLRGHFPGEVEALVEALGQQVDGWLLIPFFLEGGRLTINDTHYVAEGDWLTPAGETEFARDVAFGYRASNLKDWVAEKTDGRIAAETVTSISLTDIRQGGPEQVAAKLSELHDERVCIINIVTMRDLEVFVLGLLKAEGAGKRFVYRRWRVGSSGFLCA